jgi:hypothetical protein
MEDINAKIKEVSDKIQELFKLRNELECMKQNYIDFPQIKDDIDAKVASKMEAFKPKPAAPVEPLEQ